MKPMQADKLRSSIYTYVDDIHDVDSLKYILQTVYFVWTGEPCPELEEDEDEDY